MHSQAHIRAWARKLQAEALMLGAMGLVDEDGGVHCRECGAEVERSPGWFANFECVCGWRLMDLELLGAA